MPERLPPLARLAPWAMSAESFELEVRALRSGLLGDDELELSHADAVARLEELVPKLIDDGAEWVAIHERIMALAVIARMTTTTVRS